MPEGACEDTPGYKTLLRILLTHSTIPVGMIKVHLTVAVEGRLTQKWFPAAVNLVYTFAWNKTDIYGQKVWGLASAGDLRELPRVPLRGEGSRGGGGAAQPGALGP